MEGHVLSAPPVVMEYPAKRIRDTPDQILHISLGEIADGSIRRTLPYRVEFPFSVVAVYLAEQHSSLPGIIFSQVVNAHLIIISRIYKTDERILDHSKMLIFLMCLVNIYR